MNSTISCLLPGDSIKSPGCALPLFLKIRITTLPRPGKTTPLALFQNAALDYQV